MRRLLPFAGGTAAVLAVGFAVSGIAGTDAACAQGSVAPRIACPTAASPPVAGGPGVTAPPVTVKEVAGANGQAVCRSETLLSNVRVRPVGRGGRVTFRRRVNRPVRVDVFQSSTGRRVLGERLVLRRSGSAAVTWNGLRQGRRPTPSNGFFFVRISIRDRQGRTDTRRVALRRAGSRFALRRSFQRRDSCAALRAFKLERPVFGGARNRAVSVSFRIAQPGRVVVELVRGGRTVKRLSSATRAANVSHRVRLPSERLRRGGYQVRLRYSPGGTTVTAALTVERI